MPVAESQLSVEDAPPRSALATTGGTCCTRLCSPAIGNFGIEDPVERGLDLRQAPDEDHHGEDHPGHPGAHAGRAREWRVARLRLGGDRSDSSLVDGIPDPPRLPDAQEQRPARPSRRAPRCTSTSHGPWKFETRNCGIGERDARRPGSPARPPASPRTRRRPRSARTARCSEKNGSWRPTIALSSSRSRPVHPCQRDDRRAQRAEGHRRGVGDQREPDAAERREAQADQDARRSPPPACRSRPRPRRTRRSRTRSAAAAAAGRAVMPVMLVLQRP